VVFQDARLIPHRTVTENVAFPLEADGWSDVATAQRVTEVLQALDLQALARVLPPDLSSSERARVAIARAIVHEPMILLMDEPLSNLDPQQSTEILKLLRQFHQSGATIVLATHDLALAQSLPARMVELKDGKTSEVTVTGSPPISAKHEIFSKTPEEAGKRRIKVTAIHS
jgi:cell division transport system ATP-binding protein